MNYAVLTNPGDRQENEDYIKFQTKEEKAIFVLADGLGGHGDGQLASSTVCNAVIDLWNQKSTEHTPIEWRLAKLFDGAQEALLTLQKEKGIEGKAKTTLVILMIEEDSCIWGHIGDSRLYFLQNHKIVERTLDHSVPQMLVNSGAIKEKKIRGHEDRSVILRAMGTPWEEPRYEISQIRQVQLNDSFLLCSDGFWELIVEKQMEKLKKKAASCQEWISMMAEIVKKNGQGKNMDNYSAITVHIGDER